MKVCNDKELVAAARASHAPRLAEASAQLSEAGATTDLFELEARSRRGDHCARLIGDASP